MKQNEVLLEQIKQAATSMLSDEEICIQLNITQNILQQHYQIVEQARVSLKQKLNAKRISTAAQDGRNIDKLVDQLAKETKKANTWGGRRINQTGRPKGSTNKVNAKDLVADFEQQAGMSFEQMVNQRILQAIAAGDDDRADKLILGMGRYYISPKVSPVDVTTNGQMLNQTPPNIVVNIPKDDDDQE